VLAALLRGYRQSGVLRLLNTCNNRALRGKPRRSIDTREACPANAAAHALRS